MIEFVKGDFFDFDADIRVNTVNCVGVMGTGVALAFKEKYPDMFKKYVKECKQGLIKPGTPSVWINNDMFAKKVEIINFPTKNHWRNPSTYEYIENGLKWLSDYLKQKKHSTITLPALGCGHGGLDWVKVKYLIKKHLSGSQHRILVFEPKSSKQIGIVNPKAIETNQLLEKEKIKVINRRSSDYPDRLKSITKKDLYLFNISNTMTKSYDISIISSTKPNFEENLLVEKLVIYCKKNNFSILFGSSKFDKRIAFEAAKKGMKVGVFMPTDIYKSAQKSNLNDNSFDLTLLSIGNPFESFDRKAYMPSVLSRLFLAKKTVFTTNRLEWISKQKSHITKSNSEFYYYETPDLSEKDLLAIDQISATKIEIKNGEVKLR